MIKEEKIADIEKMDKILWNLIKQGKEREVVLLRLCEYSYDEIATLLNITHDDAVRIAWRIRTRIEEYETKNY